MMTYKEAITRIKIYNEHHSKQERFALYITEALEMATKALEKQKLKKVIIVNNYTFKCPCCSNFFFSDDIIIHRYCNSCGQALDWSYENE